MRNAVILHGKPKKEVYLDPSRPKPDRAHWLPWARERLEERGIPTAIPAFPEPYNPNYEAWRSVLQGHHIGLGTRLIGHSAGACVVVRYLSENPGVRVNKVILVAPWLDPTHKYGDFGEFTIDSGLTERCLGGLGVFYSSGDDAQALASKDILANTLPSATFRDFPDHGHFMIGNKMSKPELPELLEVL